MDGAFGLGGFGVSGSDPFKIAEGSDTPNVFNVPQLETPSSWKEFLMTTENKQKHGVGVPSDQQTFSGAGFGGSQQGMQFDNYHQQPLFGSQQQPQERPTSSVRAKSQPPLGGAPTATPFPMDSEALLKLMTTQGRQQGFNNRAFSVRAEDLSERGLMEWILANQGSRMCHLKPSTLATIHQEDLDGATFLQWRLDEMRMVGINPSQCKRIAELQRRLLRTAQIPTSFHKHQPKPPSSPLHMPVAPPTSPVRSETSSPTSMHEMLHIPIYPLNRGRVAPGAVEIKSPRERRSRSNSPGGVTSPKRKHPDAEIKRPKRIRRLGGASIRSASAPPAKNHEPGHQQPNTENNNTTNHNLGSSLPKSTGLNSNVATAEPDFLKNIVMDSSQWGNQAPTISETSVNTFASPRRVRHQSTRHSISSRSPRFPPNDGVSRRRAVSVGTAGADRMVHYSPHPTEVKTPPTRAWEDINPPDPPQFFTENRAGSSLSDPVATPSHSIGNNGQPAPMQLSEPSKTQERSKSPLSSLNPSSFLTLPDVPVEEKVSQKSPVMSGHVSKSDENDDEFWSHLKVGNELDDFLPLIDRDVKDSKSPMLSVDTKAETRGITLRPTNTPKIQLSVKSPHNGFSENAQKHMKFWSKNTIEPGMTLEYDRLLLDP
ncbi:hypothetical protein AAMO2058_000514900 [Amorphochlora amoebiformis]